VTWFRDLSIKGKLMLITMLINTVSLMLASAVFVFYELAVFRGQMRQEIAALAEIIAGNNTGAVAFEHDAAAQESLDTLRKQEHVVAGCIYRKDGTIFVHFRRDPGVEFPPVDPRGDFDELREDGIVVFRRLIVDREHIGTVYVRADVTPVYARLWQYLGLVFVVLLGSSLLALVLTTLLQKVVSQPILDLARTATRLTIHKDYSVRAPKGGRDEIGVLIDGFNAMLAMVEEHETERQRAHDVLEQRVEERTKALRESERRFRDMLQNLKLLAVILDSQGNVTFCNEHLLQLTGWPSADVLGQDFFGRFVVPERRPSARGEFLEKVRRGELSLHEESEIVTRDAERRLVSWTHTVLRDAVGRVIGTASIGIDMTEEKRLEERLRQSQKLEAVGRLAGGVAHDFNNLLTIILGYSDLVLLATREATVREHAGEVKKASERAAALTKQLLAFSRRQVLQPSVLDLNAVVADTDKMLRRLIGEDIELLSVGPVDLGRVKADRGQIEQVLVNLVVNARDAMPEGGSLTIETENVHLDEAYAHAHGVSQPGPYVRLSVTDNGHGMDAATQARIFEPFFTTKKEGKGTGLGLATVYGIVKQSGGYIWVYSEPGRGTTFRIYLPRAAEDATVVRPAPPPATTNLRGTETILVVEDDESLRRMAAEALQLFGFRVLQAPSAEDALTVIEQSNGIDLLLTDIVMPHMSGRELARQLATRRPDLKIIFMSGYAEQAAVRQGLIDPHQAFISKPFTPEALVRKLRSVLDGADAVN
jgi:two-component system, cell cycle sensor histidine kinase and response regulator CckA